MYVIKAKKHIQEQLRLENGAGEPLELTVDLWIDDVLHQYNKLRLMLGEAQHELQNDPHSEKAQASYGAVLVTFLELIFGTENVEKLLAFYANRYTDLLEDVAPFIVEVIQPKVNAAIQTKAQNLKKMAQKARKARR